MTSSTAKAKTAKLSKLYRSSSRSRTLNIQYFVFSPHTPRLLLPHTKFQRCPDACLTRQHRMGKGPKATVPQTQLGDSISRTVSSFHILPFFFQETYIQQTTGRKTLQIRPRAHRHASHRAKAPRRQDGPHRSPPAGESRLQRNRKHGEEQGCVDVCTDSGEFDLLPASPPSTT